MRRPSSSGSASTFGGGRKGWHRCYQRFARMTQTSIDGYVNVDIADPVCGSDFLCEEIGNLT